MIGCRLRSHRRSGQDEDCSYQEASNAVHVLTRAIFSVKNLPPKFKPIARKTCFYTYTTKKAINLLPSIRFFLIEHAERLIIADRDEVEEDYVRDSARSPHSCDDLYAGRQLMSETCIPTGTIIVPPVLFSLLQKVKIYIVYKATLFSGATWVM